MNNPYMHNKRKKADVKEQVKKAKKAKVNEWMDAWMFVFC